MARIEFRGQTYNDEDEMPYEIRQAYRREKQQRSEQSNTTSKPLSDIVDMSPDVKAIYERALGDAEKKLASSQRTKELPRTEDIYRQSAPADMKHLPSDESIYRPSQPLIDPEKPAIEPESGLGVNRLVSSIVWVLILIAVAYLVMQLLF